MLHLLTAIAFLWQCTACHKKDVDTPFPAPTDSLGKINAWVYDSMRYYYYWNQSMPAHPDISLPVADFFKSLLAKEDRFSSVSNGITSTAVKPTFAQYGFQYAWVQHPANPNALTGVVLHVAAMSTAWNKGLRRGSCFVAVNNTAVTISNVATIDEVLHSGHTFTMDTVVFSNSQVQNRGTLQLAAAYIAENPVVATRLFQYNGVTTGYLFYNAFDEQYDVSLLTAMEKIKQAGASECIVDLRYNPGGSTSTAAKLAAMLVNVQATSTFAVFQGNGNGGKRTYTFDGILRTAINPSGKTFSDLAARSLSLKRVFILTTRSTVSAAELLVQSVKPYAQVIQLGDTTLGKDEASFQISDMRTPRQINWVLQPTIYKLFNANGTGNYNKGIAPFLYINELSVFPLQPEGSVADPLVQQALQTIYGRVAVTETNLRHTYAPVQAYKNSAAADAMLAPAVTIPR
ncbi:S41 family peptidase [Deminuibacter soli]|uniref:S41 family peptidase n=1 Tax=Deminuibacter soli TaxID=2291815 RepID=UPI0013144340|nr:S41 family peptidase [Deminuibacter soli]